jgi:hypothetical protein
VLLRILSTLNTAGPGGQVGQVMELKSGNWIATQNGERGKVIHTSRLTVFVAFPREGQTGIMGRF